ncbi:hypothetical protein FACS1894133_5090 [Clostridia bacterium]|nr:hypothetical protein FACS1894133_5090 [Clostridia bacterium]
MNIEVRYLSKSGNTEKIAKAIAATVGVTPLPITEPLTGGADILFLGGALYGFGVADEMKSFIQTLDNVRKVAVFSTTAVARSAYPQIRRLLTERGIVVMENEFHCRGGFKFLHKGRPNGSDLKLAREFARAVGG